jgi:hypothetical protein
MLTMIIWRFIVSETMDQMENNRKTRRGGGGIFIRNERKETERQVRFAQPDKMTGNGIGLELCAASLSCWLNPKTKS